MELLVLFISAVIWLVLKSLAQSQPSPRPARSAGPAGPGLRPLAKRSNAEAHLPHDALAGETYFADQDVTEIQVEELDAEEAGEVPNLLTRDNLLTGIIMSEVLGPPRAKRPHRLFGGR